MALAALEKDLGTPLLAFACHDAEPAAIGDDQLARIRQAESALGVALVAVKG